MNEATAATAKTVPSASQATCGIRCSRSTRIAARTGLVEPLEVALPELVLVFPELAQVLPREDAGVVTIGEHRPDRIVSDRFEVLDRHVALADLKHFLTRTVAADFGRWRVDAQVLVGKLERATIRERDLQHARGLVCLDLGRMRRRSGIRHAQLWHAVAATTGRSAAAKGSAQFVNLGQSIRRRGGKHQRRDHEDADRNRTEPRTRPPGSIERTG